MANELLGKCFQEKFVGDQKQDKDRDETDQCGGSQGTPLILQGNFGMWVKPQVTGGQDAGPS